MEINLYAYGKDGRSLGVEISHSDVEVDLSGYTPPAGHTFQVPPKYTSSTQVPVWEDGKWVIHELSDFEEPKPTLEQAKSLKLEEIALCRWSQEISGMTLPDGTIIKTDRESQALLTGAALAATIDPVTPIEWKGVNSWVTLTAAQVLEIAAAVRAHVQAVFSREKVLSEKVEACEDIAEVEAITW